eukprot:7390197-Prymnesium_polylepis.1
MPSPAEARAHPTALRTQAERVGRREAPRRLRLSAERWVHGGACGESAQAQSGAPADWGVRRDRTPTTHGKQQRDDLRPVLVTRDTQRALAGVSDGVHVRAACEQQLHALELAVGGRHEQRRRAEGHRGLERRAGVCQDSDALGAASFARDVQWRRAVRPLHHRGRASLDKQSGALRVAAEARRVEWRHLGCVLCGDVRRGAEEVLHALGPAVLRCCVESAGLQQERHARRVAALGREVEGRAALLRLFDLGHRELLRRRLREVGGQGRIIAGRRGGEDLGRGAAHPMYGREGRAATRPRAPRRAPPPPEHTRPLAEHGEARLFQKPPFTPRTKK